MPQKLELTILREIYTYELFCPLFRQKILKGTFLRLIGKLQGVTTKPCECEERNFSDTKKCSENSNDILNKQMRKITIFPNFQKNYFVMKDLVFFLID